MKLAWTGERCLPWIDDVQVVYEHLHRYYLAASIGAGRRILDLGCGEGYGSAILAEAGPASVLGVDIDQLSIEYARETYRRPNLSFAVGAAPSLSDFPSAGFDLVVCFEVIEHLEEQEATLSEIVRLLAPEGVLFMSTPDRAIYSEDRSYRNPFHVREMNEPEFTALLARSFSHLTMWGQNVTAGSFLIPLRHPDADAPLTRDFQVVEKNGGWETRTGFRPTYLVAMAGNAELPRLPAVSHLLDPDVQIFRRGLRDLQVSREDASSLRDQLDVGGKEASSLRQQLELGQTEASSLREQLELGRTEASSLRQQLELGQTEASSLRQQLDRYRGLLRAEESRVTRLNDRLRIGRGLITSQRAQIDYLIQEDQALRQRTEQLHAEVIAGRHLAAMFKHEYELVTGTKGWKLLDRMRRVRRLLRAPVDPPVAEPEKPAHATHRNWEPPDPWDGAPFSIRKASDPLVSIVIPVHNGVDYTAQCLRSIKATSVNNLIEIVVVDDVSDDATAALLAGSTGITVVRNESNLGFVASVNAGVAATRGRYILMLNNDTVVRAGWLPAMLDAMSSADDIGAVGAKLIYPDGRLQEAGGIIWNDASGWNFGRGQDPAAPQYNFRREVDYCSAAALMVRRDLLEEMGLMDRRFDPGYYEDTDLCFALRRNGYRVIYEPKAEVVHYEGISFGTDAAPNTEGHSKGVQEANRQKFIEKWGDELALQYSNGEFAGLLGGRRREVARILVIDEWVPQADRDAGSLRMKSILLLLHDLGHHVSLFPRNRYCAEPYTSEFQRAGIEVLCGLAFDEVAKLRPGFFDTVLLSRPGPAAELMNLVRRHFPEAVLIYDTVDLHQLREQRGAEFRAEASPRTDTSSTLETDFMAAADITIAVTDVEERIIRSAIPSASTFIVPTVHESIEAEQPPFEDREGILFLGSYQHPPNVDAVFYLVEEILPLLHGRMPIQLWVVGSNPPPSLITLRSPDIIVTGHVPDLEPFFARARVFVAPLRYGAGMKGKIGQAMSYGLPVVTTPIGAEGMGLHDGKHVLIRDDPEGFADAVIRLYGDKELWERLAVASQNRAREWSPASVKTRLTGLLALASRKRILKEESGDGLAKGDR